MALEPSFAGFGEIQPDLGLTKPRSGWVPSNPTRLGLIKPNLARSPLLGLPCWVPMRPSKAGFRRDPARLGLPEPNCWVRQDLAGFR
ncbi:hypothetical protein SLEP1_g27584 [Rubroshorea leprosula]|uniref:Uncharacterized protein n=1 Tax=Rubroshorea leprosula TaxID=152421 RepID=A0AAV5JXC3_9ROSI|nr:hypothetical protein SLEP1_g27584 [Rubroshorea leprosula]